MKELLYGKPDPYHWLRCPIDQVADARTQFIETLYGYLDERRDGIGNPTLSDLTDALSAAISAVWCMGAEWQRDRMN